MNEKPRIIMYGAKRHGKTTVCRSLLESLPRKHLTFNERLNWLNYEWENSQKQRELSHLLLILKEILILEESPDGKRFGWGKLAENTQREILDAERKLVCLEFERRILSPFRTNPLNIIRYKVEMEQSLNALMRKMGR